MTQSVEFVLRLLEDPSWRQRLVERVELGWSDRVHVESRYQLFFPQQRIEQALQACGLNVRTIPERVRMLMPITTRPKRPLIDLRIDTDQDHHPHLLLRNPTWNVQTLFLLRLRDKLADQLDTATREVIEQGFSEPLLEAICDFHRALFDAAAPPSRLPWALQMRTEDIRQYLNTALDQGVKGEFVEKLLVEVRSAGDVIARALDENFDMFSSAENVLLAAPLAAGVVDPSGVQDLVEKFTRAVQVAEENNGGEFLRALGDYGRRWEMILDIEAPVGEPFTVSVREDRPLHLRATYRAVGRCTTQRMAFMDAESYHAQYRSRDHSVEFGRFYIQAVHHPGADLPFNLGVPIVEDTLYARETIVLYTSHPKRPYYADIVIPLRTARYIALPILTVQALVWSAIVSIALMEPGPGGFADGLGVLSVAATIAAALVLIREQSSLAGRLQFGQRLVLCLGIAMLWVLSAVRILLINGAAMPEAAQCEAINTCIMDAIHQIGGNPNGEAIPRGLLLSRSGALGAITG